MTIDKTTRALIGGAFLYSLAFVALSIIDIPGLRIVGTNISPFIYLTPLFGLPYLLLLRPRVTMILYFLVLVPIIHNVAMTAAIATATASDYGSREFLPGAIGGLIGSTLSFAILALLKRTARTVAAFKTALFGIVALTAIGSVGLYLSFVQDNDLSFMILYLPWQLVFALCLGRLLHVAAPASNQSIQAAS